MMLVTYLISSPLAVSANTVRDSKSTWQEHAGDRLPLLVAVFLLAAGSMTAQG